ncbi:MAG TPA: penicillin acylase family protein [Candidatus Acidoferrum sp.]|nr:penicillin acylase family protein [Candidatus Acidoferrum sp.]
MAQRLRIVQWVVAGALLVAGVVLLGSWWVVERPLPKLDGNVVLLGLKVGVIVDRDTWGRPWIRAQSEQDLVEAQGYVMAQDRLWQMDLLRRAAGGDLSEIFGDVTLEYDKENRMLGMHEAAERAAQDSSPEIRALLEAYARGVNEYIQQRSGRLPMEFALLGYKPKPWTPADTYLISLYMYKTLTATWKEKLNRQWATDRVGAERAKDLFVEDSPLDHYIVDGPNMGEPARVSPALPARGNIPEDHAQQTFPYPPQLWGEAREFLREFEEDVTEITGSNNFVVSGALTATGKPLLANDTHLALTVPALWYVIHLTAPGWNVEGFALPGAPMVIIGHNDRIAWGFTNSNADVADLYEETFEADGSLDYRANGSWIPAQVRKEIIHVRGKPDVELDVEVTRHGPVIRRDSQKDGGKAYALRWIATEPGGLDFGFPMLGKAQNWDEFIDVTRNIAGPGQNTIYADVDGNIGFTIPAKIPIRAHGDGALPVPGDTDDYDWTGYIPFDDLPRVENPAMGVIATANARTVGPGYKYYLTDRWAGPYRTARIYEMLAAKKKLTVADCNEIQNDVTSLPDEFLADQLLDAIKTKRPKDFRAVTLIVGLNDWDGRASKDSAETSFLEFTRKALFEKILAPYLGNEIYKYELWEPESAYNDVWWRDKVFLTNVLLKQPPAWLPAGYKDYGDLLMASADDALLALEKLTGEKDPAKWNWGGLHPLMMSHPLGRSGILAQFLSIGPYPQGGTVDTVRAMGIGHGPAMRFVADLANFDDSLMEVPTGESGQYGSRYYRDQFPEWFAGRGIEAPFSEAAEAKIRAHRLTLLPLSQDKNTN